MRKTILLLFLLSLTTTNCSVTKLSTSNLAEIENLKAENEELKKIILENNSIKKNQIATFLTFQDDNAENAMNFYVTLFENSKIINIRRWGKEMPDEEGKIMHATFEINGSLFMCSDSPPIHNWDFSPAVSNYINCKNETELERLFMKLSENGKIMMPLNNYGFSKKFGWVIDQFGISWQLNLA